MPFVAYPTVRADGLQDTDYYVDGVLVARLEGYPSGEEADADFREWWKTERMKRESQEHQEVRNTPVPG